MSTESLALSEVEWVETSLAVRSFLVISSGVSRRRTQRTGKDFSAPLEMTRRRPVAGIYHTRAILVMSTESLALSEVEWVETSLAVNLGYVA